MTPCASLDTIGEALAENGKVIVTGCLGAKAGKDGGNLIQEVHPSVLAVTGPHATQEVMNAVHTHLPKPHDPFIDLVPGAFGEAGIKLTPRHYAYLKISGAATTAAPSASSLPCAAIWFRVRWAMCSRRRVRCSRVASRSCW